MCIRDRRDILVVDGDVVVIIIAAVTAASASAASLVADVENAILPSKVAVGVEHLDGEDSIVVFYLKGDEVIGGVVARGDSGLPQDRCV